MKFDTHSIVHIRPMEMNTVTHLVLTSKDTCYNAIIYLCSLFIFLYNNLHRILQIYVKRIEKPWTLTIRSRAFRTLDKVSFF